MTEQEIGRLTRWEIFNILCSTTDEDGQIHVDEQPDSYYEQMRDKALGHGFDFPKAVGWATEKAAAADKQKEDQQWQGTTP
jgi:hypothetical protein